MLLLEGDMGGKRFGCNQSTFLNWVFWTGDSFRSPRLHVLVALPVASIEL